MIDYSHVFLHQSFFAYGLATGIFVAVFLFMALFAYFQYFINKRQHGGQLFFYNCIAIISYCLFSIYSTQIHFPIINEVIPTWIIFLGKIAVPLGLYMNGKMLIKSIPAMSLRAFSFWHGHKIFYRMVDCLYLLIFVSLIFIEDYKTVMVISLVLALLNIIVSLVLLKKAFTLNRIGKFYSYALMTLIALLSSLIVVFMKFNLDELTQLDTFFIAIHLLLSLIVLFGSFILSASIFHEIRSNISENELNVEDFNRNIFYALKHDEFFLEYQPKIDLKTHAVSGVEALIRWNHSKKGIIPPYKFIPIAERTEIINHISKWVIAKVAEDSRKLLNQGFYMPVAINFSVKSINSEMLDYLQEEMNKHGIPSNMVTIEITESLFLHLNNQQKETMDKMRELGFRLSLDDFSAGFSSLQHLGDMQLDELKIDRALTTKILDRNKNTVVTMIMEMCRDLGIEVVAEGIDDIKIQQAFANRGCEMAQGFGICRPKKIDDFIVWFDDYENLTEFYAS